MKTALRRDARILVVAAGFEVRVQRIESAPAELVIELERAPWIAGRVVDGAGGIPGARLHGWGFATTGEAVLRSGVVGDALLRTGTDGGFALPPPVEFKAGRLVVEADGYPLTTVAVLPGTTELVVTLEPGAWVEGEVVDEAGRRLEVVVPDARFSADGKFELGPLASGIHEIEGSSPRGAFGTVVALRPGERRSVRIVVDEVPTGIARVRMAAVGGEPVRRQVVVHFVTADGDVCGGAGATSQGWTTWSGGCPPGTELFATAHFEDDDDRPLVAAAGTPFLMGTENEPADAEVHLLPARFARLVTVDAPGRHADSPGPIRHTVAGRGARRVPGGLFVADGARFRLGVTLPGWVPHDAQHDASEIGADGVLRVVMSRGATVRGRFVAEDGGYAGSGKVAAGSERFALLRDGEFALANLPPGDHVLHFEHGGGSIPWSRTVHVEASDVDLGEIRLPRMVRVAVHTTPGATVRIEPGRGEYVPPGDDGIVRGSFPAGTRITAFAHFDEHHVARPVVFTATDGVPRVELRLERAPVLLVAATFSDANGVDVRIRFPDGTFEWEASRSTWGRGKFRVELIPPGRWDVVLRHAGREFVLPVDLAPGEVRELSVPE